MYMVGSGRRPAIDVGAHEGRREPQGTRITHVEFPQFVVVRAAHRPLVATCRRSSPISDLSRAVLLSTDAIMLNLPQLLMAKGGGVDKLTANKIEDSWKMVKKQVRYFKMCVGSRKASDRGTEMSLEPPNPRLL